MDRTRLMIGLATGALLVTMLPAAVSAAGPSPAWTRQFGTGGYDFAHGTATDSRGRVAVAGDTTGALPRQTNRGLIDAYVRVYQRGGRHAWTRQFGTSGVDSAWDVAVDRRDRVIVAGGTEGVLPGQSSRGDSDAFVRVYKPNGRVAWTRQFGSSDYDEISGVAVDGRGRIVVAGFAYGAVPGQTHAGDGDALVRVYQPNGRAAWTRQFGTPQEDAVWGVAVDRTGRIAVVGYTGGTLTRGANKGQRDIFVRVYTPTGRVAWTRQFGSTGDDIAWDVAVDRNGRVFVVGGVDETLPGQTSTGMRDAYVRVYQRGGRLAWTRQFGTDAGDDAFSVAVDSRGRSIVTGRTGGAFPGQTFDGNTDVFLRLYRPNGRVAWTNQFSTGEWGKLDDGRAVAVDRRDRIVVAGITTGTMAGSGNRGDRDVFVRKLR